MIVLGDFREPDAKLQWESIDSSIYTLDGSTLSVGNVDPDLS